MASNWPVLERALVEVETERGGVLGVTVIAPSGERWSRHGNRRFGAASTVKIPLMVDIFRGIDRGVWALDDQYTLRAEDKAAGSGVLLHLREGLVLTLADLLYLMISISDNTATNVLIRQTGMDAVNATMRELGMSDSNLGREMKGRPAIAGETENWATPDDYASVMRAIIDRRAASPAACDAMLALLERQQNPRRIARHLPEGVRWGSKTGSVAGVVNDVGFIAGQGGTLVIAAFAEGFRDPYRAEEALGAISRAAWTAASALAGAPDR